MGRFSNFIRYGQFLSNEMLEEYHGVNHIIRRRPSEQSVEEFSADNEVSEPPRKLEKDDYLAMFIAAVQVFGPLILVCIVVVVLAFWFLT